MSHSDWQTGRLSTHWSWDKVPVVYDSSRDEGQVVGVAVGAVVASVVVTQSHLYRRGLCELMVTSEATELLLRQSNLWTYLRGGEGEREGVKE